MISSVTSFNYDDALLISNLLTGVSKNAFIRLFSDAIYTSRKGYLIVSFNTLLQNIKDSISVELRNNKNNAICVNALVESDNLLNRIIDKYGVDNLDYESSEDGLKLIVSEFNKSQTDLKMELMYKEGKYVFVLVNVAFLKFKMRTSYVNIRVDFILLTLSVLMFIIQLKVYSNSVLCIIFTLIVAYSCVRLTGDYSRYNKDYKNIKRLIN